VINTDYYSIEIPASWNGKYSYEQIELPNEEESYTLAVYMTSKNGNVVLFTIEMYSIDSELDAELQEIGNIKTDGDYVVKLAWEYPGDIGCADDEVDQYLAMQGMTEQIINTLELNFAEWLEDGTTSETNETYDIEGAYVNDSYEVLIYSISEAEIEIQIEGDTIGTAELVSDTGNSLVYEGRNESGTLITSLQYNYEENSISIDTLFTEDGKNYYGTYYR
jgi:hypothetical protein